MAAHVSAAVVPKAEQDKQLLHRIIAKELPGVLAWLVRGCLAWQRRGLGEPRAVVAATAEYQRDEDVLAMWIGERCRFGAENWQGSQQLYESYKAWCKDEGIERPWTLRSFVGRMTERDGIHRMARGSARGLKGIRLLETWEAGDEV